jgi:hypothetical protein
MDETVKAKQSKRRPRSKADDTADAYWQARARLKLLKRNANAFVSVAEGIYELLKRNPPSKQVVAHTLPHPELTLQRPTAFRLRLVRRRLWQATLPDLPILGNGVTQEAATRAALKKLAAEYLSLEQDPSADPDKWHLLRQLVRRLEGSEIVSPAGPQPETVVVDSEASLTIGEWLEENAPEQNAFSMAWRRGACARLYGRSQCRYRGPNLIEAWNDGFAAMNRYLEAGGALACTRCLRPLALAQETVRP